jgi:hypothetical protein
MSRRAAFLAHPTVRALLDADVTTSEPDVAIRRRARDLVAWARGMGWDGPPFDLELLASLCGFRVEYTPLGARQDGWIDSWRRRILINAEMHELRQRFTLAHEIAHTLLPDFGLGTSSVDVDGDYEWAEQSPPEQLCQVAAAELLMPADAFREACGDRRWRAKRSGTFPGLHPSRSTSVDCALPPFGRADHREARPYARQSTSRPPGDRVSPRRG